MIPAPLLVREKTRLSEKENYGRGKNSHVIRSRNNFTIAEGFINTVHQHKNSSSKQKGISITEDLKLILQRLFRGGIVNNNILSRLTFFFYHLGGIYRLEDFLRL